ncbi:MAG: hypothetical protein M1825_001037 [Sarcosagium campestre]|nr:MAG: hypothetical protein M1825_001037 [Sarcosagium campestre]
MAEADLTSSPFAPTTRDWLTSTPRRANPAPLNTESTTPESIDEQTKDPLPSGSEDPAEEDTQMPEQPETPAPTFVLRALKTALFGTPKTAPPKSTTAVRNNTSADPMKDQTSPIKRSGILLTPGTGPARRKTVSFGESLDQKTAKQKGKSGLPDNCPGKFPSPWTPRPTPQDDATRMSLTKSFRDVKAKAVESSVDEKPKKLADARTDDHEDQLPPKIDDAVEEGEQEEDKDNPAKSDGDADLTLDFDHPRSQSGQWWRSEFHSYHEKTQVEMEKLIKYKDLAKSYARHKDTQAFELAEKLRAETQKVSRMEEQITQLVSQLDTARTEQHNVDQDVDKPRLLRELARQTDLVLRYRRKAEKLEKAARDGTGPSREDTSGRSKTAVSPKTERVIVETSTELKKAREQVKQMNDLRSEVRRLQGKLEHANEKVKGYEEEKKSLAKTLTKMNKNLDEGERRRAAADQEVKERLTRSEALTAEYEERLIKAAAESKKSDEREAENARLRNQLAERDGEIKRLRRTRGGTSPSIAMFSGGQKQPPPSNKSFRRERRSMLDQPPDFSSPVKQSSRLPDPFLQDMSVNASYDKTARSTPKIPTGADRHDALQARLARRRAARQKIEDGDM